MTWNTRHEGGLNGRQPSIRTASFYVYGASAVLLLLWLFPYFWYNQVDFDRDRYWFSPGKELEAYTFTDQPLGEAMERRLVADTTFNGQFQDQDKHLVHAFMAKRYRESSSEIGLFVHTPDRCWTEGGWKMIPVQPDHVEVSVRGQKIGFERRMFVVDGNHALVYFTGMVGGQTLPYRLDHNLSVAMKYQRHRNEAEQGTSRRMVDTLFWRRVWDAFVSRRPLLGPKQFVRVSTFVFPSQVHEGDQRLQSFLEHWLERVDYRQELESMEKDTSA
jgi:hypothetical protein